MWGKRNKTRRARAITILVSMLMLLCIAFTLSYFSGRAQGEIGDIDQDTLSTLIKLNNGSYGESLCLDVSSFSVNDAVAESVTIKTATDSVDAYLRVKVEFVGQMDNYFSIALATALNAEEGNAGYTTYSGGVGYSWQYLNGYYYLVNNGNLVTVSDSDGGYILFQNNGNHETVYMPDITKYNIFGASLSGITFNVYVQAIIEDAAISTASEMQTFVNDKHLFGEDIDGPISLVQYNTMGGVKIATSIVTPEMAGITLPSVNGESVSWYQDCTNGVYSNLIGVSASTLVRADIPAYLTLYAKYQTDKIAVMFEDDTNATGSLPSVTYIDYNVGGGTESISVGTSLTRAGYSYDSWVVNESDLRELNPGKNNTWIENHLSYTISANAISMLRDIAGPGMAITLHPNWQALSYTATFDPNGGDLTSTYKALELANGDKVYEYDSVNDVYTYAYDVHTTFTFPLAEYADKVFTGWLVDVSVARWRSYDVYGPGVIDKDYTGNVTFIAQWGELEFTNLISTVEYSVNATFTLNLTNSTGKTPTYQVVEVDEYGTPVLDVNDDYITSSIVTIDSYTTNTCVLNLLAIGRVGILAEVSRNGSVCRDKFVLQIITRSITSVGISVSGITSKTYTGTGITQNVTITDGGYALTEDTHYTIAYANNVNKGTNTAEVIITGIGGYTGTRTEYFTILGKEITITAKPQTITYTGSSGILSTPNAIEITSGSLITGHSISAVTLSQSTFNCPGGYITVDSVTILTSGLDPEDVTSNYNITTVNGALTINKAENPATLSVTANNIVYEVTAIMTATVSNVPVGSTVTYAWYKSTDKSSWTVISGETTNTYTIAFADIGYFIKIEADVSPNSNYKHKLLVYETDAKCINKRCIFTLDDGGALANGTRETGSTVIYESYLQGLFLDPRLVSSSEITTSSVADPQSLVAPRKYYTITFDVNSGNYIAPATSQKEFYGYYTEANGGGVKVIDSDGYINSSFTFNILTDITLYAYWGNFESFGDIPIPNGVRPGYSFQGWYADRTFNELQKYSASYVPTADMSISAKWLETFIEFRSETSFTITSLVGYSWGSHDWGPTNNTNDPTNRDAGDGTIEYSTDLVHWTTWTKVNGEYKMSSGDGNVIYVRGTGNRVVTGYNKKINGANAGWKFVGANNNTRPNISCFGNIETLLDWRIVVGELDDFDDYPLDPTYKVDEQGEVITDNHPKMDDMCYRNLFANNVNFLVSPTLPALTLTKECYASMFNSCTALTSLPELPATTLAQGCYAWMYENCTNFLIHTTGGDIEYTLISSHNFLSYDDLSSNSSSDPFYRMFHGAIILTGGELMNSEGSAVVDNNNECIISVSFVRTVISVDNQGGTGGVQTIFVTHKQYNELTGEYDDVNIKEYVTEEETSVVIDAEHNVVPTPTKGYTVTYDYNGGSVVPAVVSSFYGYTFLGVYTQLNGGGSQIIESDGTVKQAFIDGVYSTNMVFYADWQAPVSLITLPTPTRTGYIFGGWCSDELCTDVVGLGGASYAPNVNMTLYAKWTPITYIIRFDPGSALGVFVDEQDGVVFDQYDGTYGAYRQSINYDAITTTLLLNHYSVPGYSFLKWTIDGFADEYEDGDEIGKNWSATNGDVITFKARWVGQSSWRINLANAGANVSGTSYLYVDKVDNDTIFFDADHLTPLLLNGQITIPQKTYTVTFNLEYGTVVDGSGDPINNFETSRTITCTFDGYFDAESYQMFDESGYLTNRFKSMITEKEITSDKTFVALWSIDYSVASNVIELPYITRDNYIFQGWYTDNTYRFKAGDPGDDYLPIGTGTLVAKWSKNFVEITGTSNIEFGKQNPGKKWDGDLYYSFDLQTWTIWDGSKTVTKNTVRTIYLRGTGNSIFGGHNGSWNSNEYRWVLKGTNISMSGNFESLLDYTVVAGAEYYYVGRSGGVGGTRYDAGTFGVANQYALGHPIMGVDTNRGCAQYLFRDTDLVTVSADFLPSPYLQVDCYRDMFRGCGHLTSGPNLLAETLRSGCYNSTFRQCTSLTTIPYVAGCVYNGAEDDFCEQIFSGCSALTEITMITVPNSSYTLTTKAIQSFYNSCTLLNVYEVKSGASDVYENNNTYVKFLDLTNCQNANNSNAVESVFNSVPGSHTNKNAIPGAKYYTTNSVASKIIFNFNGGSDGSEWAVAKTGQAMPYAVAPRKEGYTFGGYYDNAGCTGDAYYNANMASAKNWDKRTNNTQLYAKWIPITYTVLYHINDGDTELVKTATLAYNATLPTNIFSLEHYTFDGWSLTSNGSALTGNPTAGELNPTATIIHLYATWV